MTLIKSSIHSPRLAERRRSYGRHLSAALLIAASIFASAQDASAQSWTGGGNGVDWNDPANWNTPAVGGIGTFVGFNNATPLITNQNAGNPYVLGNLQANGAGTLTINGNPLNFHSNMGSAQVFGFGGAMTINAPLILTSNTQFQTTDLTVTGGISGPGQFIMTNGLVKLSGPGTWTGGTSVGAFGSGVLQLLTANSVTGTVNMQNNPGSALEFALSSAGTFNGTLQGFGTVRQAGPAPVLLGNASPTFFGFMEVAAGTLQTGISGSLGTNQTTVLSGAMLQMAANDSLAGPALIQVNAGGTLDAAGFSQAPAVRVDNNGSVLLPAGSQLTIGGSSTWTGGSSGVGNLNIGGFATMSAGTTMLHTGGTNVSAGGFLHVNSPNLLADTGLLYVNGGTVQHISSETIDNLQVDSGNASFTTLTANAINLQSGFLGGNITANGAFTKTGAGTATFNGNLTPTAGATVTAGQLDFIGGALNGSIVNNATLSVGFLGIVNGPTTNNSTLILDNSGQLAGATTNAAGANINVVSGFVAGTVANSGAVNVTNGSLSADISGAGTFTASSGFTSLSGNNTYTGGSTATNALVVGDTDAIQGNWSLIGATLDFNQNVAGTMAGTISGAGGNLQFTGSGPVTFTGNNSFTGPVFLFAPGAHMGLGSNTAAGIGGVIQGSDYKLSAEGGARSIANPIVFGNTKTEFTGSNNLTLTDAAAKTLNANAQIKHTSTATTSVAGTFLGQNTATINVNSGTLVLGAPINNGFRMDGAINVASGATLEMVSNSLVKLGPTNLNGGTLKATNGVAVPTGLALNAAGTIQGRVALETGSVIEATGALTMGDANSFAGFFSNGELREESQGVTILDKNQAVMGSLTEVGNPGLPGTLNIANGAFVDFGAAITGYGTVNSTNALAQATIVNGSAAGLSGAEQLDFTGYVKGVGDFSDVTFSGTFSPGLSPAITPVNNVNFGVNSVLLMEIGGLTPGSQHDQLLITGNAGLNGTLDVDLIMGFNPSLGDSFLILNGPTSGAFTTFSFPALNAGLMWSTANLYSLGTLEIVQVPEPSTVVLAAMGAIGLFTVARRRRRSAE